MPSIQDNIEAIRQAVYGREVRSAIADSIEQFNERTEDMDNVINERVNEISEELSNKISEDTTGIIIAL